MNKIFRRINLLRRGRGHRGRTARYPSQIPLLGWRDILLRVYFKLDSANISILSAGVAFYAMLAIFPALTAIVSIYALLADPADVYRQFDAMSGILPLQARDILSDQLASLAARSQERLGLGLLLGLGVAIWSAHRGIDAIIRAITVVYDERETRGYFLMKGITLSLTFGAVLLVVFALTLTVALPALSELLHLPRILTGAVQALVWPLLAVVIMFALAVLYRLAPPRRSAKWRWVSWGSVLATLLWLGGSGLFSFYVASFASYNEMYGSVGAIVILLLWFFLTTYAVLLGAALNAEMELQTTVDSTHGPARPMGQRGAYVADNLGEKPSLDL